MTSNNGDTVVMFHETTALAASVMVLVSLAAVRDASAPDERRARRRLDVEIARHITDFARGLAIAARAWAVRP